MENLKSLENFYEAFSYFLEDAVLLDKCSDRTISSSNLDDVETIKIFFNEDLVDYDDSSEVYEAIDDFKIIEKYSDYERKKNILINKIIGFISPSIMKLKTTNKVKDGIFSSNFLDNVSCLIHSKNVIHHSHIIGDIIRYAHNFCNFKVRENKNQISVIAHNLFGFDIFFLLKGLRLGSWRTRSITTAGTNLLDINFANIANQVKLIDTIKSYQQSLAVLAGTVTDPERRKSIK